MTKTLVWEKCRNEQWCDLKALSLDDPYFDGKAGAYIIWHGGPSPRTVRVGQGVIRDRLKEHRKDPAIQAYDGHGLFATWANVAEADRDGVERFLAERLQPLVGARYPDVDAIPVNLPWDE